MAITNADGSIVLTTKVDTTGLKKDLFSMKNGASSLTASLGKLSVAMAAAFSVKALINFSKEAAVQATSVEASVQRLIDIYGEASQVVGDFIDSNARALGMSKAAATSFSAVYGNLFSVWADQATNAELTNQYLQMTAVIASKTGRTVEDVQERIRSGLLGNTEAIEDLGVFVNVKTIEMTDAFQRMADGKSWEQLDAYTQQQIRSMAILEQATAKYGDEVANTSATVRNRFKAAYEDFQATWGEVINRVLIPALNILTEMLNTSTAIMQGIFEISGETISGSIDGAKESQKKFNNELKETNDLSKKTLASFDDIQILSSSKNDEKQGEGNLFDLDLKSSNFPKAEKEISHFVKKITRMIQPLKRAFVTLSDTLTKTFKPLYKDVFEPFGNWFVDSFLQENIENVVAGVQNLTDIFNLFGDTLQNVWNDKLKRVFEGVGSLITLLISKITESFSYFSLKLKENEVEIEAIIKAIATVVSFIWDMLYPALKAIIENIGPTLKNTLDFIFSVIKAIGGFLSYMENIFNGFKALIQGNTEDAKEYFKNAASGVLSFWQGAINGIISLLNLFIANVFERLNAFIGSFGGFISSIGKIMGKDWNFDLSQKPPQIPLMQIPALAQGTVVPPNKRFIAELGDNTREHEIVSPLSTIEQAVENVLGRQGGATREEHYYLNETQLMSVIYRLVKGGEKLRGVSLEDGGY